MPTPFPFFHRKPSDKKSISPKEDNADVIEEAQREIIRQARRSYNLCEAGIAASIVLGIVTGALTVANRLPEAGATAVTVGCLTYSTQLNKEAQENLKELLESLKAVSKG